METNYELVQDSVSGGFYFLLKNADGDVLAKYPRTGERQVMEEKMQATIVYIQEKYAPPVIEGGKDRFGWEVNGADGETILHSYLDIKDDGAAGLLGNRYLFKTKTQAVVAMAEAMAAATNPYNFRRSGFPSEKRYFFYIDKAPGFAVAQSIEFSDPKEREKAIEAVQSMANDWIQDNPFTEKVNTGYRFQFYRSTHPDEKWMDGTFIFADGEAALEAGQEACNHILEEGALAIAWDEGICQYRIELTDPCGTRVAVTDVFPSLKEAKKWRDKIKEAAGKGRLGIAVVETGEAFRAAVCDEDGELLLQSYQLFEHKPDAVLAYLEIFQHGADRTNYSTACNEPFVLLDVCGRKLATSDEPCEDCWAKINEMACYFQEHAAPFSIPIAKAPYKFLVTTTEGETLMEGVRWYSTLFEAKKAYWLFLCRAANAENYRPLPDPDGCRFGFGVVGEEEEWLGKHPVFYPKQHLADEKQAVVVAWMQEHCYDFRVELKPGKCFFEIYWIDCDGCCRTLLHGPEFSTKEEAVEALENVLDFIKAGGSDLEIITDDETGNPSFALTNEDGNRVAWHSGGFVSDCMRDAVVEDAETYLSAYDGILHVCVESTLACDPLVEVSSVEEFADPAIRDRQMENLQSELAETDIDSLYTKIVENNDVVENDDGQFVFKIINAADKKVFWKSVEKYGSREEAFNAFEKHNLQFIDLARKSDNYLEKNLPAQDPAIIQLLDTSGEVVAEAELTESFLKERSTRLKHAIRYPFIPDGKKVRYRLFNKEGEQTKVVFESALSYSLKEAKKAFQTFIGILTQDDNGKYWLKINLEDRKIYRFLLSKVPEVYGFRLRRVDECPAEHPMRYPNCKDRDKAMAALWEALKKGAAHLYSNVSGGIFEAKEPRPSTSLCYEQTNNLFHFEILDEDSRKVLWRSWKAYPSAADALMAFEENYLQIIAWAREKDRYLLSEPEDDKQQVLLLDDDEKPIVEIPPALLLEDDLENAWRERLKHALRFPFVLKNNELRYRLFDYENNKVQWVSRETFTDKEKLAKAFNAFLDLLRYKGNWLKDGSGNEGSRGFHLGNALLESHRLYTSEDAAWEALKDFLIAVQGENGIWPFKDYAADCCFAFEAGGDEFLIAEHPDKFRTFEEREVTLYWLYQRAKCRKELFSEIEVKVKCRRGVYYFFIFPKPEDADDEPLPLWQSFEGYHTSGEAEIAAKTDKLRILELAREPGFYCLIRNARGKCEIHLVDLDGRTVAKVPQEFELHENAEREAAIVARIYQARMYPYLLKDGKYIFQLYDTTYDPSFLKEEAEKICNGESIPACEEIGHRDGCLPPSVPSKELPDGCGCDEQTELIDHIAAHLQGGVVWESAETFSNFNQVQCAFQHFIEKILRDAAAYRRVEDDDCGPYQIMLTDPFRSQATHPRIYPTDESRQEDGIGDVESAINAEGFHVLEHILLRPFQKTGDEYYVQAVWDEVEEIPGEEGGENELPKTKEVKVLLFDRSFSQVEDICGYVVDFYDKIEQHGVVGASGKVEIVKLKQAILKYDLTARAEDWSRFLGHVYGGLMDPLRESPCGPDNPDWTKHLVFYNKGAANAKCDLLPICVDGEECDVIPRLEDLDLLPNACGTAEELEERKIYESYLPGADPYSFYMTVAIPFWPRRFLNVNFRSFFEETVRREAPAHVWVRIVWLHPRQMRQFEQHYREWLNAKSGLADCDLLAVQRRLLKATVDLKNEYLPARLYDCEGGGQNDVIFLDQTKLG